MTFIIIKSKYRKQIFFFYDLMSVKFVVNQLLWKPWESKE